MTVLLQKNQTLILFFILLILSVMTCAATAGAAQNDFKYRIGLGDIIEVQVWKEPELSKTQPVRIDGRISLPLLGDIDAVGRSTSELSSYLETQFSKVVSEPAVSVMLKASKSWRYYIVGEISKPGEFNIDYPITILQAIARSGGFKEWAKKSKISIIRRDAGKDRKIIFDYDEFIKGDKLNQNILISPGDTIIIP